MDLLLVLLGFGKKNSGPVETLNLNLRFERRMSHDGAAESSLGHDVVGRSMNDGCHRFALVVCFKIVRCLVKSNMERCMSLRKVRHSLGVRCPR